MERPKPWQIAVIVLGIAGLGFSFWYSLGRGDTVEMANSVTLADVSTGELLESDFPSNRTVMYPAKNPGSGSETLYPVTKRGETWVIVERFRPAQSDIDAFKAVAKAVPDLKSFEVKLTNPKPKRVTVWK